MFTVLKLAGGLLLIALLLSCGSTDPQFPSPPFFGDPPQYVDGDLSLGEAFLDLNSNGVWDPDYIHPLGGSGEPFIDVSGDSRCNTAEEPWVSGVPFLDLNLNGSFDFSNGEYDRLGWRGRDEPWIHALISEGEMVCVDVPITSPKDLLSIEALPPGAFNEQEVTVCWIPTASGAQFLTVVATNGRGESDTLDIPAFISIRPVIDSIAPTEVLRGEIIGLIMYIRHSAYETLQPWLPSDLVTFGEQRWSIVRDGVFPVRFGVSDDAPLGAHDIGLRVPGIMNSSNTVPLVVTE